MTTFERKIYLDEAGNTGADLLDDNQPVFVLSSNDFTEEESSLLIDCVKSNQGAEVKFRTLKKSDSGKKRLLKFFEQPSINKKRVKTSIYHKGFMALTKVVDIIVENVAIDCGIDLYEKGANIAMSNMHYYCLPILCGQDKFTTFLKTFIVMLRQKDNLSIKNFYKASNELYDSCSDKEYASLLIPILISDRTINEILEGNNYLSLDPAIPSLFDHCISWGEQLKEEFIVVHDSSKPIRAQLDLFNKLMEKDISYTEIGYDRRKFTVPLRSNEIAFGDSKSHSQIQIADLIASASAYIANASITGEEDDFAKSLISCGLEKLIISSIWPTTDVTPEELGTAEKGGINAVNYMTFKLQP